MDALIAELEQLLKEMSVERCGFSVQLLFARGHVKSLIQELKDERTSACRSLTGADSSKVSA